ncbi:unnamed protein product, partial [Didymodactylos carnosus]
MDTTRKQTTASHRKTAVHESKTQFLQTLLQASITTRSLKSNGFSDDDRTQSYRVSDIDQQAAKLPQTSTNLKKKFYTKRQQDEPVISIQSNSNKLLEKNILTGSTTKNSNPLSSSARLSYKSDAMSQTDGITQLVQQNFLNHRSSTESSVAPVTTVPSPLPPPPAPPLPSLNIAKFESVQKPELHLPKSELISIVDGTMWGAVNKSLRGPQRVFRSASFKKTSTLGNKSKPSYKQNTETLIYSGTPVTAIQEYPRYIRIIIQQTITAIDETELAGRVIARAT